MEEKVIDWKKVIIAIVMIECYIYFYGGKQFYCYLINLSTANVIIMAVEFVFLVGLILMPYEKIAYRWRNDIIGIKDKIFKIEDLRLILTWTVVVLLPYFSTGSVYVVRQFAIFFILAVSLFVIMQSYYRIKDSFLLFFNNEAMILITSILIERYMNEFYYFWYATLGLTAVNLVRMFISDRNIKSKVIFCIDSIFALGVKGFIIVNYISESINANASSSNKENENYMMQTYGLNLRKELIEVIGFRHPFARRYSLYGLKELVIYLAIFVVFTVCVILCNRLVSKNRFLVMLGLFGTMAIPFVYSFMADLGIVPTSSVIVSFSYTNFMSIILMIRLLWTRKIPEEKLIKYEKAKKIPSLFDIIVDKTMLIEERIFGNDEEDYEEDYEEYYDDEEYDGEYDKEIYEKVIADQEEEIRILKLLIKELEENNK